MFVKIYIKLLKMSINMLDIRGNYVNISNKMRRELKEDFDSHRCVWCVNEYKCVCVQTQYDFEI
jgi:hypothetical protein